MDKFAGSVYNRLWRKERMSEFSARNLDLPENQISEFCTRWRISEFALFGSVLRDDFDADSDLDILVAFAPDADWSLLDHVRMEQELEALLGRKVDLLSRRSVERSHNWLRRKEILDTAEVVYASR
jgi:predicted nucleotidyltransferase